MLKKKIQELEQKIKELEDGWRRTQADFENYRKRTEAERGEILNLLKADFLTKITPVLDNFRRAFEHAPDDEFSKGIKQIEKQLENILLSEGLQKIPADTGDKFDPNLHEAITHEPNKKIPSDHIIAEVESGWMFANKVIKPAKVRVSKGKK
jgi:molecular chaperone GrpE